MRHRHDGIDHALEANVLVVLQAHHANIQAAGQAAGRQQALRLQLLATQAHHHGGAAEIGVQRDIAQRADRHDGVRRIDGHATAVGMLQPHHVVHIGILRQQLGLDAPHRVRNNARHALHGGGDGEDVAGADRAVRIAEALEAVAFQRRQRVRHARADRQVVQLGRHRHLDHALVDPATLGQVAQRIADHHVVAHHGITGRQIRQRHLVALRHPLAQGQPAGKHRALGQAAIVGDDRHVIQLVDADVQRGALHLRSRLRTGWLLYLDIDNRHVFFFLPKRLAAAPGLHPRSRRL